MARETEWTDYITCPRCGARDVETTDYPFGLDRDGAEAEVDCQDCGRPFRVALSISYAYQSTAIDDEPPARGEVGAFDTIAERDND